MRNTSQEIANDLFSKLTQAKAELESARKRGEHWPKQEIKVRKLQSKIAETKNEMVFDISVSEDNLILLTEMLILSEIFRQDYTRQNSNIITMSCSYQFGISFSDTLRDLLEIPLQNSNFRKLFTEHFVKHTISLFREDGAEWLEDVLVWEK